MSDSMDKLAALTGRSRETMLEIAAEVKANHARLDACPWHEFEPDQQAPLKFGHPSKYRCKHCLGMVDSHAWYWHEQGRREKSV